MASVTLVTNASEVVLSQKVERIEVLGAQKKSVGICSAPIFTDVPQYLVRFLVLPACHHTRPEPARIFAQMWPNIKPEALLSCTLNLMQVLHAFAMGQLGYH